ncbi:MAG: hypothetical protein M3Y49_03935 [Actinomycetota bacterium]|nr:hypothetical protein [Actinomycetota bacterium]
MLVAIRERDHAVLDAERRAGEALTEMIENEGLAARDAVKYCGGEVSTREVARLRRTATATSAQGGTPTRHRCPDQAGATMPPPSTPSAAS